MIEEDRRLTVRELAEETGISKTTIDEILVHDLQLKHVPARWVPHLLTDANHAERVRCSREFFSMMRRKPDFLDRVITAPLRDPRNKGPVNAVGTNSCQVSNKGSSLSQCPEDNGNCPF